jgi:alpha-L-arabinofuranosidase
LKTFRKLGFLSILLVVVVSLSVFIGLKSQELWQKAPVPVTDTQVTIDPRLPYATIPTSAFGMNTAVWDNNLLDPGVPGLLRQAKITMLRFPGGSTADVYHWQNNSITLGRGYVNPNNTFDAFMGVVHQIDARAFITVNYGSNIMGTDGGDPTEAAAWVHYANMIKRYGITHWEIGNEVYGNGTYSSKWEADLHATKGPVTYANNVLQYVNFMKGVDSSIKVGVALTIPVDTRADSGERQMADWNKTILSIACSQIDFVDIHWYPRWHEGDSSDPDAMILARTSQIPGIMSGLRLQISQYCGTHAKAVQIFVGETNTGNSGKQRVSLVNALFLADSYMTWLENGASNVSWWDLHNGIEINGDNNSPLYGTANYGDQGILANGTCTEGVCEPATNTPFPPYYGMQMLTHLGVPGDQIVSAASQQRLVAAHAVKQTNGNLALLLINKDPSRSYTLTMSLSGYKPASRATVYSYGMQSTSISVNSKAGIDHIFKQTLPPYSLTTVVLTPAPMGKTT